MTANKLDVSHYSELEQQNFFVNILFHDACHRGGMFNITEFKGKKFSFPVKKDDVYPNEYWTRDITKLCAPFKPLDTYLAINSFRTKSRKGSQFHTINGLYFDLDHHGNPVELKERISNTIRVLDKAILNGVIPEFTMMTHTGRGIGCFYILKRSIAHTDKTNKQVKFWGDIYRNMANIIANLISQAEAQGLKCLEVDNAVIADKSRLCRMPGTLNGQSGTLCTLQYVNIDNGDVQYYTLKELAQYMVFEATSQPTIKTNILDFNAYKSNYMLAARADKLRRAHEIFKKHVGRRELLCFVYYDTIVQLYPHDIAVKMLNEYNQAFEQALPQCEINNVVRSVDKVQDEEGNVIGHYNISDQAIIQKLGLKELVKTGVISHKDYEYIGFGNSTKEIKRAEKKAANEQRRNERNQRIANYIKSSPEVTYETIAGLFGVSLRTIKNIAQANGISRYVKHQEEIESTREATMPIHSKVQNNAPYSIIVVEGTHRLLSDNTLSIVVDDELSIEQNTRMEGDGDSPDFACQFIENTG